MDGEKKYHETITFSIHLVLLVTVDCWKYNWIEFSNAIHFLYFFFWCSLVVSLDGKMQKQLVHKSGECGGQKFQTINFYLNSKFAMYRLYWCCGSNSVRLNLFLFLSPSAPLSLRSMITPLQSFIEWYKQQTKIVFAILSKKFIFVWRMFDEPMLVIANHLSAKYSFVSDEENKKKIKIKKVKKQIEKFPIRFKCMK